MSAILSADDLNDFISPGVACIKPIETLPKDNSINPYEVTTEDKLQTANPAPASISLTDCLACSGCVTSAEAVLVSLQSHAEVLNTLEAYEPFDVLQRISSKAPSEMDQLSSTNAKVFVASVSPQVRASMAATYKISERQAGYLIEQLLSSSNGITSRTGKGAFAYVVDTNRMREACLVLAADEVTESLSQKSSPRPILTSACPGWICYAEKTHPHVLPHLSKLKSPQALTGTLLKSVLSERLGIHPSQIWHLAIMPCFDKKLEASREELTDRWWQPDGRIDMNRSPVRDVDCVITSRELLSLANGRGIKLTDLPLEPLSKHDRIPFPDPRLSRYLFPKPRRRSLQSPETGTSGGYLYHILKSQQALNPGSYISSQKGRNADVVEYTLSSASKTTLMKCARFYGFRNIQNLVRKLKPQKSSRLPGAARRSAAASGGSDYAYVEVMACPGGCTNGGGQLRAEDVQDLNTAPADNSTGVTILESQKDWLGRVDEAYYSAESESDRSSDSGSEGAADFADEIMVDDDDDMIGGISTTTVHRALERWAQLTSIPLNRLVYTDYRKVESDVGKKKGKAIGDSERIAAIAGATGGGW